MSQTMKMIGYAIGGVLLVVLLYWGYLQIPNRPSVADQMNQQKIEELKAEHQKIIAEKEAEIAKINVLLSQYKETDTLLRQEIERLKGKKNAIKEPQTYQETIDRFKALGYHPY